RSELARPIDRGRHRTRRFDVVLFDEDAAVQAEAVIRPASGAHRVFLQRAQTRMGLSGVDDTGTGTRDCIDEAARLSGDSGKELHKIECDPLAGQETSQLALEFGEDFAILQANSVFRKPDDVGSAAGHREHALQDESAGKNHPRFLDHNSRTPPLTDGNCRAGSLVTSPDVFDKRAAQRVIEVQYVQEIHHLKVLVESAKLTAILFARKERPSPACLRERVRVRVPNVCVMKGFEIQLNRVFLADYLKFLSGSEVPRFVVRFP